MCITPSIPIRASLLVLLCCATVVYLFSFWTLFLCKPEAFVGEAYSLDRGKISKIGTDCLQVENLFKNVHRVYGGTES